MKTAPAGIEFSTGGSWRLESSGGGWSEGGGCGCGAGGNCGCGDECGGDTKGACDEKGGSEPGAQGGDDILRTRGVRRPSEHQADVPVGQQPWETPGIGLSEVFPECFGKECRSPSDVILEILITQGIASIVDLRDALRNTIWGDDYAASPDAWLWQGVDANLVAETLDVGLRAHDGEAPMSLREALVASGLDGRVVPLSGGDVLSGVSTMKPTLLDDPGLCEWEVKEHGEQCITSPDGCESKEVKGTCVSIPWRSEVYGMCVKCGCVGGDEEVKKRKRNKERANDAEHMTDPELEESWITRWWREH